MTAACGRLVLLVTLASLVFAGAALGQTYEAGLRAYEAGNYDQAYEVWRPLAQGGDPVAQYSLGKLYERGGGAIGQNFSQAARWYGVAARQGIAAAQNNLALMYAQGRGVSRNVTGAIDLWLNAARQNHPMAQYNLGLAYFRGEGVAKDEREAAGWFRRAADAGLGDAQYAMGQMNRLGLILPKDQGKALSWYKLASDQGHREAKAQVQLLEAGGVAPSEPGAPQIMPTGLAVESAATLPPARTTTAALEALEEPHDETAVQPRTAVADEAPAQAGLAVTVEPAAQGAVSETNAPEPAMAGSSEATTAAPAEAAAEQMTDESTAAAGGVPVPRQKPAVPQLAMQPLAPSPYPDEALEEGAGKIASSKIAETAAPEPQVMEPQVMETAASETAAPETAAEDTSLAAATPVMPETPTAPSDDTEAKATMAPGGNGLIQVWLASEKDPQAAMKLWPVTKSKFPDLLAKAQPDVAKVTVGEGGTFFRLMAGPLKSRDAARDLCALMRLQDEDAFCKVLSN